MRFLYLSLRIFGVLVAVAIAVPVLAIAALQVPAGRDFVSGVAGSLASSADRQVTINDLYLGFGLNASVGRVTITDTNGIWLEADRIALDWSPLGLLAGDLTIDTISAGQLDLNRLPEPPESPEPGTATSDPAASAPTGLPLNVRIGSLSVTEINIGEPILGVPVALGVSGSGSAALDPTLINADLDVRRVDGVDGHLTATATFDPGAETLAFDIDVSEPRGGLAARLLEIPDLPAVTVSLTGDGPLTDWAADLSIALDGRQTASGNAWLSETSTGRRLAFDLNGDLAPLAPPEAQAFLLGTTNAKGTAEFSPDFKPQAAQVDLNTQTVALSASGSMPGGRIDANASLSVNAGQDALIALDLSDRRIAFGPLTARFTLAGPQGDAEWTTAIDLASFQTNEVRTGALALNANGSGANLSPDVRSSPLALSAKLSDVDDLTGGTGLAGLSATLTADGDVDGANASAYFGQMQLTSALATLSLSDTTLSPTQAKGQGTLAVPDLNRLSQLAQRELRGSATNTFSFALDPAALKGTADLSLVLNNIQTGLPQADALLAGRSDIDLSATIDGPQAIDLKRFSAKASALSLDGSASYSPENLSSDITASLSDLSKIEPQLAGTVDLSAKTSGPIGQLAFSASAKSDQILLAGTPLDNLAFAADGVANPNAPTAQITSSASLNGQPLSVDLELVSRDGGAVVNPLSLSLAGNTIKGELEVADLGRAVETLRGDLAINAPDLSTLSPLALTDLGGRVSGTLKADPQSRKILLDLEGSGIDVPTVSIGTLNLKANATAPYNPQTLEADIEIADLITDATPIRTVALTARPEGTGTAIAATVKLDDDGSDGLDVAAHLSEPETETYALALRQLSLAYQGLTSQLAQPATITYSAGSADIEPLTLQLGQGSLSLGGQVGEQLDLQASMNAVPLNLANAFVPSLGLGGTVSGTLNATGTAAKPDASWTVTGSGLTATELKTNGLTPLALNSTGTLKQKTVSQQTRITDANGLTVSATGTVGLDAPMPLALSLNGTVPTAVLRRPLLEAGIRAEGAITLDGKVSGSANALAYAINATPSGLKVTSLSTGLTVQNIRGSASVNQERATLSGIVGDLATGGSLSASGTVGMKDGFAANLAIGLNNARYIDPGLVTAEVGANIKINGPLASPASSALIAGSVTINKADVSIPEYLPGAIAPVEVQHLNASAAIRRQVAELGGEPKQNQARQRSNPPRLDILLSAPGRIFIRGRGLDAELEGNLKIVGTTADPQAIGAFSLRRGQLDILARRLTFQRGSATFEGSLTPLIDFAATTTVNSTAITVTVSGDADEPEIKFSSSPELPQDEVLALLLFGRSVGNLSATQVAQLAAAIATLTGGSDSGPLAQIRKSLGLDAIDINTTGEDGPSVAVGKYINDNIYLGVEQGTGSNSSRVKVDIDLDRGLKVRGEVGADGSSKAGIFFEREY